MNMASSSSSPSPMSSPSSLDDRNLRILKWVKLLLSVVFVGWIMIWIMAPTNTYRNIWSPKLASDTDSTYFGKQGLVSSVIVFIIVVLLYQVFSLFNQYHLIFFVDAGTNILICTFPILFIFVLGCIYLHMEKGSENTEKRYI